MQLTPLETQLLTSAVFAVPAIILLLVAVFTGGFSRSEEAKYIVLMGREHDYWDETDKGEDDDSRP